MPSGRGVVEGRALYEYIPDAFEILLGDDDMFGGYVFRPTSRIWIRRKRRRKQCALA
jgi:uncharacterized circularly permuted ATP-grasp superfamily protein